MITKQVILSTGVTVTVAPVPQKIYDVIRMKHPDPPVPTVEGDLMGEKYRKEIADDAGYQQALRDTERARQTAWAEAMLLFGLPEVRVPEGYRCPRCQFTAESKEGVVMEWQAVAASRDGTYYCPKCLGDGNMDDKEIPTLERYVWELPLSELAYIAPDWKPRKGDQGRKLDYIEWELLRAPGDQQKVIAAINVLAIVPEEAVDAIEDTFQGDVEVSGTGAEEARDTD